MGRGRRNFAAEQNDKDKQKDNEQLNKFKEKLKVVLGNSIKKPSAARLGYRDSTGATYLQVPQERTDQPNRYYFHEAGGTSFQGEAFLQPGALSPWQIRFGTPIRVRRDPLSGEWEIVAIDSRYAVQYFNGMEQDDGIFMPYEKLAPGMLTQTEPLTMKARVLAGAYRVGDDWKYIETQETVNFGIAPYNANIPTTVNKAKAVLVQLNFATELLEYKYGAEIPSSLNFVQAYQVNKTLGDNSILPTPDANKFRCGYLRLVYGMDRINRRGNIWTLQEYLASGGAVSDATAGSILDRIVTDDVTGEIVVDSETGNVVYV